MRLLLAPLIFTGWLVGCSPVEKISNLPPALKNISSDFRENSTIIFVGTFETGRAPCEFLPDGSHRWMRTTGFRVNESIRGEIRTPYVEVHLNSLVQGDSDLLQDGQKYYVFLSAHKDLQKRLRTDEALFFKEALAEENILGVVDLDGKITVSGSNLQTEQETHLQE